jgi:signal peptidase I
MTKPDSERAQTARTFFLALIVALGVRTGVAQAYVVEGPSMGADGLRG